MDILRFLVLCKLLSCAHCKSFTCGHGSQRVLSSADFHGDWDHAVQHLTAIGVLDDGKWSGGSAIFVYTGDIVDRGDHGKALWELMFKLQDEAPASGGRVILLLGNHELMNLQEDLRYVTPGDFAAYGGRQQVADVLYVHAGLLPEVLARAAPGAAGADAIAELNRRGSEALAGGADVLRRSASELIGDAGPFWTRELALGSDNAACSQLERTLRMLKLRRMVVGHTPEQSGSVRPRCGGRLLLADTFMSQAYTGSAAQSVLHEASVEFYDDSGGAMAVYPQRDRSAACVALPLDPAFAKAPFDAVPAALRGSAAAATSSTSAAARPTLPAVMEVRQAQQRPEAEAKVAEVSAISRAGLPIPLAYFAFLVVGLGLLMALRRQLKRIFDQEKSCDD
eukprot:TRINITY_DN32014_c0_g1_i1.p1 TRINITY_DN32014_c0_g1~~TRINITY_DN32014_c0_g1_i1.p1  ORF type:complete len:395 (-),score=107.50 TRINITY_DN32014_c0_g1_i1:33-1217(-)